MYVGLRCNTNAERTEKKAAGFEEAVSLPYTLIKDDEGQPVLCVSHTSGKQEEAGWFRATPLPSDYLMWAAARQGMNYQDFHETDWDRQRWFHWTQRRENYYRDWEDTLPEHPHCILPRSLETNHGTSRKRSHHGTHASVSPIPIEWEKKTGSLPPHKRTRVTSLSENKEISNLNHS